MTRPSWSRRPTAPLKASILLACVAALVGCTGLPAAPTWSAAPGSTRTLPQFHLDDAYCRSQAEQSVAGRSPEQAATESTVGGAVVGAAVGAIAGGLLTDGRNLGAGAATGAVIGSLVGSSASGQAALSVQQRYDQVYYRCMYALGHRVPVPLAPSVEGPAPISPRSGPARPAPPARSAPPAPPSGPPPAPPRTWQGG